MRNHQVSTGKLLVVAALMLIAGFGLGWVAGKPSAWRQGYQRALDDIRHELQQRTDQAPRKDLCATPPRWRKV